MLPASLWFAFHCTLAVYEVPPATLTTVWTFAAFGEKVPPKPPLSFQASGWPVVVGNAPPVTAIPRSWLNPAVEVHRSAFALRIANELRLGVKVTPVPPPKSTQVDPLFPVRLNWLVLQEVIGVTTTKVYWSAVDVALVFEALVTVTSTVPAACGGLTTCISVSDSTLMPAAAVAPNLTEDTVLQNPEPVTNTFVPPAVEP